MVEQINKNKRVWLVSSARAHNRWDIQLPQMHSQEDQGERRLAHSQRWRMGRPSETVFWAQETEQPHGYQNEASPFTLVALWPGDPDSGAHPAEMLASYNMLRKAHWLLEAPPSSAGTEEDSLIYLADWTVLVISEWQGENVQLHHHHQKQ